MKKWYIEFIGTRLIDVVDGHSHYVLIFEKEDSSLIGIKIPRDISCEVVNVKEVDRWDKYTKEFKMEVPIEMPHHGDYIIVSENNVEKR